MTAEHAHHGTPQPATAAMTKPEAFALSERTHGQLLPFLAEDGHWYCFEVRPDPVAIEPRCPIVSPASGPGSGSGSGSDPVARRSEP